MKKLFTRVLCLSAALYYLCGFAACSSDDDSSDNTALLIALANQSANATLQPYLPAEFASKTVSALYTRRIEDYDIDAVYFFTDGKWVHTSTNHANVKGTYSGDATKDGTVEATVTHFARETGNWAPVAATETSTEQNEDEQQWSNHITFTISNGEIEPAYYFIDEQNSVLLWLFPTYARQ